MKKQGKTYPFILIERTGSKGRYYAIIRTRRDEKIRRNFDNPEEVALSDFIREVLDEEKGIK